MKSLCTAAALALALNLAHACEATPPARRDIDANSYYSDKNRSVVDPVLRARNIANTKPIEDFLSQVARDANAGKREDAACALTWLADWAGQKAMLGRLSSEQAYYVRKWTLSGMALNYARIKQHATPAQRAQIEGWFKQLADATMAHSDAKKGVRNNHYYWEGLAVTAVGGVTGEAGYLDWGRKVIEHALGQMEADGSLPAEMARGVKALHYQVYAATPLVFIASILDVRDARLDQLVAFTVAASADPSGIAQRTGFEQEPVGSREVTAIYNRHQGKAPPPAGKMLWQPRMGGSLDVPNPLEHLK
ncbi:alginate lyase family protein [Duganella sp. BuS-21]|uniref:alginate lyase family protein n=1 Tax=Duganella sp. BuS-21 TaxID=2943848 RepID=UPI0035A6FB81